MYDYFAFVFSQEIACFIVLHEKLKVIYISKLPYKSFCFSYFFHKSVPFLISTEKVVVIVQTCSENKEKKRERFSLFFLSSSLYL